jgi:MoxR-like ATPase
MFEGKSMELSGLNTETTERLPVTLSLHNRNMTTMLDVLSREYLQGKEEVLRLSVIALLTGGHILIEDLPGLGKTTVALALAASTGLSFGRVQCTSDLLPSDITGLSVFNREEGRFVFTPGPIFSNIVLLDEINRAMPRTQSAMLEAMEERRVTVEGVTHHLPDPFMVFATQNPSDQSGTFLLPESQLDRFLVCTDIGYPPEHLERAIISAGGIRERIAGMPAAIEVEDIRAARSQVAQVYLSQALVGYIHALVAATRIHPMIRTGLSTRAAINLAQAARAAAFLEGRDFVAPEDVRGVAPAVCGHRLVMRAEFESTHRGELLRTLISDIALPSV